MNELSEKLSKLPKWAQSEISRLEKNVSHLEEHIQSLFAQKETKIQYEPYGSQKLFMPSNCHIAYSVSGGYLQVRIDGDRLYVMADGKMGRDLDVMPQSSNTLTIGFGK